MDSWKLLTVVSLLANTDPNEPFILYTDAYDIAIGIALVQNEHCTPMVSTAVQWMMKILNQRRYVRCTNFMNALFVQIGPFSTAGMPRGKLLVYIYRWFIVICQRNKLILNIFFTGTHKYCRL